MFGRRRFLSHNRMGITLVETTWFVMIWGVVTMSSVMAVREATLMRGLASQRAVLGTIAHGELERARLLPDSELKEGTTYLRRDEWPDNTTCSLTLKPYSSATWLIDVEVSRKTAREIKPVRFTSIRKASL